MTEPTLAHRLSGPAGAPVLVLANSLGTDMAMWDPVVPFLVDRYQILQFDYRGQGASATIAGPCTMADLTGDLLGLLDRLDIAEISYAGVSIGGMLGLWLAAQAPARLSSLAVFCSSAHPGHPDPDTWRERARTVRRIGSVAPIADPIVDRWITPAFAETYPSVRQELMRMLTSSPPQGYASLCDLIAKLDLRPELDKIHVPTLVIAGAQDQALAPSHSAVIAAGVSGARNELLDPGAHIPMVERPAEVAELIVRSTGTA